MTSIIAIFNKEVFFLRLAQVPAFQATRRRKSKRRLRLQDMAPPPFQREDAGWHWEVMCSLPIRSPR